ncbi:tetratricopeptide repeat protein [Rufibacter tibetensis]|uniref:Uncharacterized protein n=1 Tax=Rufibacter tibetensis TaxID=512763 RepID=A0A0P0CTA7_9BACT|nr:tetratricopeptide repeat protein [Rufibacter tibetensis]ALJ00748.1 hypothetical protein DC20_19380 [Rufibacter tibetensis]
MKIRILCLLIIGAILSCNDESVKVEDNVQYHDADEEVAGSFEWDKHPILQEAIKLLKEGKIPEAMQKFNLAEKKYGGNIQLYLNRGVAYQRLGDNQEAIIDFGRCLQIDEDYIPALLNRGLAYAHAYQFTSALEDFNRAVEIKPTLPEIYANRAVAYHGMGRTASACRDIEKAEQLGMKEKFGTEVISKMKEDFCE